MKTGDRLTFIRAAIEVMPVHSIDGHEWDCAACHYHYPSGDYTEGAPCGGCGRPVTASNSQESADTNGRPCSHEALIDRDQVIELLAAHLDYEPVIDPIHWSTAIDTSGMKRVGP